MLSYLNHLTVNFAWMVLDKFCFCVDRKSRWPPPQDLVLSLAPIGKYRK